MCFLCKSVFSSASISRDLEKHNRKPIVNLLEGNCFTFTANGLRKNRNFQSFPIINIFDSMLCWWFWFTSCSLATSLLNSLIQDRARVLTSIGIQEAFIGDEQNDESVTRKKGVEGGLFYVALGTMDVSLTDGYPYHVYNCNLQKNFKRLWLSSSNDPHCIRYW